MHVDEGIYGGQNVFLVSQSGQLYFNSTMYEYRHLSLQRQTEDSANKVGNEEGIRDNLKGLFPSQNRTENQEREKKPKAAS